MSSDLQVQILEQVYARREPTPVPKLTGILKAILVYTPEEISYAMGDFGRRLTHFARSIDTETPHPELFNLLDGQLVSEREGTFSKDACDLLKLAAYGRVWGLSQSVLDNLKRVITTHKSYRLLNQSLNLPSASLTHVRFLPLRNTRDNIRCNKRMQPVNLSLLYKWGQQFWDEQASDFSCFMRFANQHQKDIEEAEVRHAHFSGLGLRMMADDINRSITELNSLAQMNQYYGFNRITVTTACTILAKEAGYKYDSSPQQVIRPDLMKFKYNFFFVDPGVLFDDRHFEQVSYAPRAYAYHEMQSWASEEVKEVIEHLENFPEIGGKPLFDHYRVLVSGLDYPVRKPWQHSAYGFRLPNGSKFQCDNIIKAQMRLDVELLGQKQIPAILLGEKDGECYFVCYF